MQSEGRPVPVGTVGARFARRSAELAGHLRENLERTLSDMIRDSGAVGHEASALVGVLQAGTEGAVRAFLTTPRVSRIVAELARVLASYSLRARLYRLMDVTPRAPAVGRLHEVNAKRIYRLCTELRGGLIKAGQFASARADLLPEAYVRELSQLQDTVPPVDWEVLKGRVEVELGGRVDTLFASVDPEPLGTASLAQVHAAELPGGEAVVIKVQLPGVEEDVTADLGAFRLIARRLADVLPSIDLVTIAQELSDSIAEELDFIREAENLRSFADNTAGNDDVVVPIPIPERSSARVLTMSRLQGARLTDYLDDCRTRGPAGEADRDRLFSVLVEAYCAQILEHGFFHADPHPGNFLVLEGPRLGVLDLGSVSRLDEDQRRAYAQLAGTLLGGDAELMAEQLTALGFRGNDGEPGSLTAFCQLLLDLFREDLKGDLGSLDPAEQFQKTLRAARANPIGHIPRSFVQLGRVFATLGGLVMHYQPTLTLSEVVLPYLMRAARPGEAGA